jgi:hypothetical protein
MIDVLGPLLPKKYSPIRPSTGDGNQGVYLAEIDKPVFDTVVSGSVIDRHLLARGGANSLTFQTVKEMLDDQQEKNILAELGLDATIRKAVIQARRGQGNVESIEKECRLTGVTNQSLLIASHIKPWRSCETAQERLDGMNGLLLTPDADLLFDRGFITFHDDGDVRVSPRFDNEDLRRLGLGDPSLPRRGFSEAPLVWRTNSFAADQCSYLAYHRSHVYVGD